MTEPAIVGTVNDACPECGRWKDFDLIAEAGALVVDCHKCGHRWDADMEQIGESLYHSLVRDGLG